MGRHKTYERDAVLDAAMLEFWRLGYEGASLAGLVAASGLNRFSLYQEFGGKEGLFTAALEKFLGYRMYEYERTLGRKPQGAANIRDYFAGLTYDEPYYGCFMFNTVAQKEAVPEAALAIAEAAVERAELLFRSNLKAARTKDEVAKGADITVLAQILLVLDQGLHSFGMGGATTADKDRIARTALDALLGPAIATRGKSH